MACNCFYNNFGTYFHYKPCTSVARINTETFKSVEVAYNVPTERCCETSLDGELNVALEGGNNESLVAFFTAVVGSIVDSGAWFGSVVQ